MELFEAFGGPWALVGFLAVVVPVVLYYAFKGPGGQRRRRPPPDAPDIDAD